MGALLAARLFGDDSLAARAHRGSAAAEEEICSRYRPVLLRFCRSILLNADEAEDAAQTALVKALESLRRRPLDVPLRPWLFRIAHNAAIDLVRRRRSHESLDGVPALTPPPEATAADRERLTQLVADLKALPDRQRAALVMRELEGFEYAEIAVALSASVGAARQTVHEARLALTEFNEGRSLACGQVRGVLEGGDRRQLRGKRMRAHLRGCEDCTTLQASIARRRRDLRVLVPALPATGFVLLGGGTAAVAPKLATGLACAICAAVGVTELPKPQPEPREVARAPVEVKRARPARALAETHAAVVVPTAAPSTTPSVGTVGRDHTRERTSRAPVVAPEPTTPAAAPSKPKPDPAAPKPVKTPAPVKTAAPAPAMTPAPAATAAPPSLAVPTRANAGQITQAALAVAQQQVDTALANAQATTGAALSQVDQLLQNLKLPTTP